MEVSELIKNFEYYNQISSDNELDLIIRDLSKFPFEDFIYIDYVDNSKSLDIRELFRKLIDKIDAEINEESIEKKGSYRQITNLNISKGT